MKKNYLVDALKQYIKSEIDQKSLLDLLEGKKYNDTEPLVDISIEDILYIIRSGIEKNIDKKNFSLLIDFVWFSGYYDYSSADQEKIAQIVNDLEDTEKLSEDQFRDLLIRVQVDIVNNVYPKI